MSSLCECQFQRFKRFKIPPIVFFCFFLVQNLLVVMAGGKLDGAQAGAIFSKRFSTLSSSGAPKGLAGMGSLQ